MCVLQNILGREGHVLSFNLNLKKIIVYILIFVIFLNALGILNHNIVLAEDTNTVTSGTIEYNPSTSSTTEVETGSINTYYYDGGQYAIESNIINPRTGENIDFSGGNICEDYYYILAYINVGLQTSAKTILEDYSTTGNTNSTRSSKAYELYYSLNGLYQNSIASLGEANCPDPEATEENISLMLDTLASTVYIQFYSSIIQSGIQNDTEALDEVVPITNELIDSPSLLAMENTDPKDYALKLTSIAINPFGNKFSKEFQEFKKDYIDIPVAHAGIMQWLSDSFHGGFYVNIPIINKKIGISWTKSGDKWYNKIYDAFTGGSIVLADSNGDIISRTPTIREMATGPLGMAIYSIRNFRNTTRYIVNKAAQSNIPLISDAAKWLQDNKIVAKPLKAETLNLGPALTTQCETTYCANKNTIEQYVCKAICWVNQMIMGAIGWAFELMRGALSTETQTPYSPNPNKYLQVEGDGSGGTNTKGNTNTSSPTNTSTFTPPTIEPTITGTLSDI